MRVFGLTAAAVASSLLAFALACSPDSQGNSGAGRDAAPTRSVSFSREIAPLLGAHCSGCHQRGGAGPFPFEKHADLAKRASQIVDVIEAGFMPPWLPRVRESHFRGSRDLSAVARAKLLAWARAGAPRAEGDDDKIPLPARVEWPLGPPDLILESQGTFEVPAEGDAILHTLVFPLGLDVESFVSAIDFSPSKAAALHGAAFLFDDTGLAARFDASSPQAGYRSPGGLGLMVPGSAGGWTPGMVPFRLPKGSGWRVGPQTALSVQLHLNPQGKKQFLSARVGIYFTKGAAPQALTTVVMGSLAIDIPPDDSDYRIDASLTLPVDVELVALFPLAHFVCQHIRVSWTLPGGEPVEGLRIEDYDLNWVQPYQFVTPPILPAGTRIRFEIAYDNSAANPQNPHHPPQRVHLGHAADEETGFLLLQMRPRAAEDMASLKALHRKGFEDRGREARKR